MTEDRITNLERKLDSNHREVMAAVSALTATVAAGAIEAARHDAACGAERVALDTRVKRVESQVEENEERISKLWVKVVAIGAALAAGGAGAVEIFKALMGAG